jgi:hypothetical protein
VRAGKSLGAREYICAHRVMVGKDGFPVFIVDLIFLKVNELNESDLEQS